jgi:hypothetical protein
MSNHNGSCPSTSDSSSASLPAKTPVSASTFVMVAEISNFFCRAVDLSSLYQHLYHHYHGRENEAGKETRTNKATSICEALQGRHLSPPSPSLSGEGANSKGKPTASSAPAQLSIFDHSNEPGRSGTRQNEWAGAIAHCDRGIRCIFSSLGGENRDAK